MKAPRAVAFTVAALAGFTLGWRIAGRHIEQHKSDLFSTSRIKRMAALSYLAGQDGPEAFQVLNRQQSLCLALMTSPRWCWIHRILSEPLGGAPESVLNRRLLACCRGMTDTESPIYTVTCRSANE